MQKIVLFASGSGSNVERIATYFQGHASVEITCVLTNRAKAPVLERCKRLGIPALSFNRSAFEGSGVILSILRTLGPDLIVLAGFLWKVPKTWVDAFPKKIINVHPALLPNYGGKGMYGMNVHQAVKDNGESETGITIHYVNEQYDDGAIIFQKETAIQKGDSALSISEKVRALEHEHFPRVIERLILCNGQKD